MITDNETNKLYLADCLKTKFKEFFSRFEAILKANGVEYDLLTNTKDVWARDFMPIQIRPKEFVQFRYTPDYLKEYPDIRTIPQKVTKAFKDEWTPKPSELVVDGGNIVRHKNTALMCDKVFHENSKIGAEALIEQLKAELDVKRIIFLPWDPEDFTGHADGMARFIDEKKVLINKKIDDKYSKSFNRFQAALRASLHNAGLEWIELPYYLPDDPTNVSARGLYLNYLEIGDLFFVPQYGIKADDKAIEILKECFKGRGKKFIPVLSDQIAREGGVLNCISWNIME
jgi:agmatine deiminase